MHRDELDVLEDALGIVLPASYAKTLRRLERKPLRGLLAGLVCTDAEQLQSLNERLAEFGPLAGLTAWPEELFVIGEDGVGNYYAIRHEDEDSSVVFYDHDRDEIQQCADSLEDFCERIRTLSPFDTKILHRQAKPAIPSGRGAVIPDFRSQPAWAVDFSAFNKLFREIVAEDPKAPGTIERLNATFGSRAVRWTGRVVRKNVDGIVPSVSVDMPPTPGTQRYGDLGYITFSLRLAGAPGASVSEAGTPQVLTTRDVWRDVRRGDRIQFLMMIAPGRGGDVSCVYAWGGGTYCIQDCGGHLLKLVERRSKKKLAARRKAVSNRKSGPRKKAGGARKKKA